MSRTFNHKHPHSGRSSCGLCMGLFAGRPDNGMTVDEELAELEPCDDRSDLYDRGDLCRSYDCWGCYPEMGEDQELKVPFIEGVRLR